MSTNDIQTLAKTEVVGLFSMYGNGLENFLLFILKEEQ
jgi:hypothetical protein